MKKICAVLSETPALRTVQISWVKLVTVDDIYKTNGAAGPESFRIIPVRRGFAAGATIADRDCHTAVKPATAIGARCEVPSGLRG